MSDIWVIFSSLPIMLILSVFVGYEPVFYMGIGFFGLSFWLFSETSKIKNIGLILFIISQVLFLSSLVFYFSGGQFPPENAFEFRMLTAMTNLLVK